jgi:hypothetical protein
MARSLEAGLERGARDYRSGVAWELVPRYPAIPDGQVVDDP